MIEHPTSLQRLFELSRALSAAADIEPFLQAVVAAASELTGCESASILEFDAESYGLRFRAVPWFHREQLQAVIVPVETSVAGWAFKNGQRLIVQDTDRDRRHFKSVDQVTGHPTRSILAVPIIFQGQPIGVLEVVNKNDNTDYTEEDVTILETLTSLTAIALQNARLIEYARRTQEEMARLDRMKSGFIAIASHELRTPLGLILGHATFLREIVGAEFHSQMDVIIRNATKLKDIIENISSVDSFQSGMAVVRRRTVSIPRIVDEVSATYAEEVREKGQTLKIDVSTDELMIEGDAEKIAIALSNLVKNAITFTNPGGHIFIVAEQIPGYVKVAVIDDGLGIPSKDLPHIFERFFQVESHLTRKHGGMGLGLSVAKMMVEMHGGRIWAESIEGRGSSFTMLLPLDSNQARAAQSMFNP